MSDQAPDGLEGDAGAVVGFFDDEETVLDEFFTPRGRRGRPPAPRPLRKRKPTHYKVVSISLYTEDIDRLGELVDEMKARGHSRANKSWVIREALRQIDLDDIPPQR